MNTTVEQVNKHPIVSVLGAIGLSSSTLVAGLVFWLDNTYVLAEDLVKHNDDVIHYMQLDDVRDELKDIRYRKRSLTLRIGDAAVQESMYLSVWKAELATLADDEKELNEELQILMQK